MVCEVGVLVKGYFTNIFPYYIHMVKPSRAECFISMVQQYYTEYLHIQDKHLANILSFLFKGNIPFRTKSGL